MKTLLATLVSVFISFSLPAQVKVGGVPFPQRVKALGHTFQLQGAGVREKLWIDLYAIGTYALKKYPSAEAMKNADEPMLLRLVIISSLITEEKMRHSTIEGFQKSLGKDYPKMEAEIHRFINLFAGDIHKGEKIILAYTPRSGTVIYRGGKKKGVIQGLDFKKALWGIWLGKNPASESLKEELVGR